MRVLVWYRAPEGQENVIVAACERIDEALSGTPGFVGSELLRARSDPACLLVLSEWASIELFERWEADAVHPETTASLREYHDDTAARPFEVYQTVRVS